MRRHRGLAVSRDPSRGESAILARMQPQRALALFLEDKAVLDDSALASGPGSGVLVIDTRADREDRAQIVAMRGLDPEEDLAAVRIKAVPDIAEAAGRLAVGGGRAGRAGRGRGGRRVARQLWIGKLGRQFQLGARGRAPDRFAGQLALQLLVIGEIADAAAVAPQEQPGRGSPVARQISGLIDDGVADTALRQDRARALAASAGVEIVAVEIEHHDSGALDV